MKIHLNLINDAGRKQLHIPLIEGLKMVRFCLETMANEIKD